MVISNFELVVESRGLEHFELAMRMCFDAFAKATSYSVHSGDGLIFYWSDKSGQPLPYVMNCATATQFAWGWLQSEEAYADLGSAPDIDGSVSRGGFRVEHLSSGYAFIRVRPAWCVFAK